MQDEEVQNVEVEVQGATFHSKEVRKVMFKIYHPLMFVQTDKPIYLPGQTGNLDKTLCVVSHSMHSLWPLCVHFLQQYASKELMLCCNVSLIYCLKMQDCNTALGEM